MQLDDAARIVDLYNSTREDRLKLDRESKALQEEETALKNQIIEFMRNNHSNVVGGLTCSVERKLTQEPSVEDWEVFRKYIIETDSWDCMNKAINRAGLKARYADDIPVPGISWFPVEKLSIHKL